MVAAAVDKEKVEATRKAAEEKHVGRLRRLRLRQQSKQQTSERKCKVTPIPTPEVKLR